MFATAVLSPPRFENLEDEMKYWKNLALQLFKEIERSDPNSSDHENMKRPRSPTASSSVSKRLKKGSLDPFDFRNICEDVQSFVTQHFSGKDFLAMSEVSKILKTILNWSKKQPKLEDIEFLTRKSQRFKEISMDRGAIASIPVSLFSDTVEKLKIINHEPEELPPMNFTKLKSLELDFNTKEVNFDWILQLQMDELEELKITNYCDNFPCMFCYDDGNNRNYAGMTWGNFFNKLKKLKRVDINGCSCDLIFYIGRSAIKLDELRLQELEYIDSTHPDSFKTLKKLTLVDPWHLTYDFYSSLMELTTLELEDHRNHYLFDNQKREDKFFVSNTIKNLSIKFCTTALNINIEDFNTNIKKMLNTFPNLETFFVSKLTSDLMRNIAETKSKMKTVKFNEIEEGILEEYEEMRQTQPNINRDIQFIN